MEPAKDFLDALFKRGSYKITHSSDVFSQQLTHQRIYGRFFVVELSAKHKLAGNYILVNKKEISAYAFPKFINSFLENTIMVP